MNFWKAEALFEWLDGQNVVLSTVSAGNLYTPSTRPFFRTPAPPIRKTLDAQAAAPPDAAAVRAVVAIEGISPAHNEAPPQGSDTGRVLIDEFSILDTLGLELGLDEPGNLVYAGSPFLVCIHATDMPADIVGATIEAALVDPDGNSLHRKAAKLEAGETRTSLDFGVLDRGYYEVHWKLADAGDHTREGHFSAGVVAGPTGNTPDSPIALDAGFGWFYGRRGEETVRLGGAVLRRSGVRHTRERLALHEVSPDPDTVDWGHYRTALEAQRNAGADILEIIHGWPEWVRSDTGGPKGPAKDLTSVYRLYNRLALEAGDGVQAWEPWNEADIFFFQGRPEEFAGIQKTAYLAIRAANDALTVTSCSTCHGNQSSRGSTLWLSDLLDNGVIPYFDVFNTHYYGPAEHLAERLMLDREGNDAKGLTQPVWLTETGVCCFQDAHGSWRPAEHAQALYTVRAFLEALRCGVERMYIFFMAEFLERYRDLWGLCRGDLTPKPAFVALANLAHVMGRGRFLGEFPLGLEGSQAYAYDTGQGRILAAWADKEQDVQLPGSGLSACDLYGHPADPGTLAQTPRFYFGVDLPDGCLEGRPAPRKPYVRPETKPLSFVTMLTAEVAKDFPMQSGHRKAPARIRQGETFALHFTAANFSDEPIAADCAWDMPAGWTCIDALPKRIESGPWEEVKTVLRVTPGTLTEETCCVGLTCRASGRHIPRVFVRLQQAQD